MSNLSFLQGKCVSFEKVGSRVTCDPAPTDTDLDVLVLATPEQWAAELSPLLQTINFEKGGSDCGDAGGYLQNEPMSFQSFTLGELNLIVTFDTEFYRRFLAATSVAKSLNLLDKPDRINLFQAVLYGNPVVQFTPLDFPTAPPPPSVSPYWLIFENGGRGCVEALTEADAREIGARLVGSPATGCERLPYPADPRLTHHEHSAGVVCPSFCYAPHQCKGRTSCPQRISCTE